MAEVLLRKAPEPRALIKRMREYHPPLGARDGLRLDFNENTFECSPRVLQALGKIAASALTRYPEREPVERKVAESLDLEASQAALDQRGGRGHPCRLSNLSRSRRRVAPARANLCHV